ncbi:helix-turn-helix domain-containing protein [Photobacterium profundum]|uniref:GlxA family transcriptional regulator n=1 Tax=Photobacterium profundum TaxID=74109 RepID=UPI003D0BDC5B
MTTTITPSNQNLADDKGPIMTPDVRFLLLPLPDFTMLPFGGFIDKLRFSADNEDYSQQRHCGWQILGLKSGTVTSSSSVSVEVQVTPEQIRFADYDYLVVFGCRSARHAQQMAPSYKALLKQAASNGVTLVTIDNACFMLAETGLLKGNQVSVHWRHAQEFMAAYPDIEVRTEQLYCINKKRISCSGGSAAIDLAIELLTRHCGRTRAMKGLADMIIDKPRGQLHRLESLDNETNAGRHVSRAIGLMRDLFAERKTTDELATMIGISRRQLDRLFKDEFSKTAHDYWHEMRLQHLHWRLVNSNHSLTILAEEIGIQDTSYLCKIFRKRFGQSPATLRHSNK